jgi:hypothetical protein
VLLPLLYTGPTALRPSLHGLPAANDAVVAYRLRSMAGSRHMLANAVQYRTGKRYMTDLRNWLWFIEQWIGVRSLEACFLQDLSQYWQTETVVNFVHQMFHTRGLRASTVCGSLSGVSHHFRLNSLPTDIFKSSTVKAAKMSITLEERAREEVFLNTRKYPFTMNMLMELVAVHRAKRTAHDDMIATAAQLAFFCLFRSSEYVPNYVGAEHNCCHAVLGQDVEFEVFFEGKRAFFNASQVTADMWPFVTLLKITLRSAKNDKMRTGNVFWFRNVATEESEINIVWVAFSWALKAKVGPLDFFLSRRVGNTNMMVALRYSDMNEAVKQCAVRFGFIRDNFGTHSLRVGGACLLRAGGGSDSMVKLLGRWRNLQTALGYSESGMREFDECYKIMRNSTFFTERDVRLIHGKVVGNRNSGRPAERIRFSHNGRSVHFDA